MESETKTQNIKLYSTKAISGATFLGGPLAAGYLIGENFKALDKPKEGKIALIIGIASTILLLVIIFSLPEDAIDSIPQQIIPIAYTALVWGIVEWKQGDTLKLQKDNENSFFSGWRAAGVGFISLVLMFIGVFGFTFLGSTNEVYDQYDAELATFTKNEEETLIFYNHLDTQSNYSLINELEKITIPRWKENIKIIKRTNQLQNLPQELVQQNKILLKYSELRLEAFELYKKTIEENTKRYSSELERIHKEIDEQIDKLN